MPALPALLLSIHFLSFLLVTMPPRSLSQAPLLSSVRMGEWPPVLPYPHKGVKQLSSKTHYFFFFFFFFVVLYCCSLYVEITQILLFSQYF